MALIEKKQAFHEVESEAKDVQERFKKAKTDTQKKKAEADEKAPLEDENGNPTELRCQLESLEVTTLHEVEIALEEAESRASLLDANPDGIFLTGLEGAQLADVALSLPVNLINVSRCP